MSSRYWASYAIAEPSNTHMDIAETDNETRTRTNNFPDNSYGLSFCGDKNNSFVYCIFRTFVI